MRKNAEEEKEKDEENSVQEAIKGLSDTIEALKLSSKTTEEAKFLLDYLKTELHELNATWDIETCLAERSPMHRNFRPDFRFWQV